MRKKSHSESWDQHTWTVMCVSIEVSVDIFRQPTTTTSSTETFQKPTDYLDNFLQLRIQKIKINRIAIINRKETLDEETFFMANRAFLHTSTQALLTSRKPSNISIRGANLTVHVIISQGSFWWCFLHSKHMRISLSLLRN